MRKRILQLVAGVSLGIFVALLVVRPGTQGTTRPGEQYLLPRTLPAPDAELIAHTGETVRLRELGAGHTLVLFFGYTSCPDICPVTAAALARTLELLGEERERVLPVLITVDPARDTPERLAAYLASFPPGLIGLTGSPEAIADAQQGYMVRAERVEPVEAQPATLTPAEHDADGARPVEYLLEHTGRVFVVHDGAVRMTFPPLTDAAAMAAGLKLLLDP